jgi:2-polyprenyl-3-methyl-5-hydroxy-6-metoxy-1,4-benzoquinol methylase
MQSEAGDIAAGEIRAMSLDRAEQRCPVCEGGSFTGLRPAFDDRYGHPGEFRIARCGTCGHLVTEPRLTEADLPELYGSYYPRKQLVAAELAEQARGAGLRSRALARWFWGTDNQGQYDTRSGERMLDVGCGAGVSLLEAIELGAEAYGIEADPNVARIARELGLRIHQGSLQDEPFPGIEFDLIVLNQVIEHIPEPDRALIRLRSRLTPDGRIVLVFPNTRSIWCRLAGAHWINWHIPYHLHHFDAVSFRRMAERCGYRMVRARTVTPNVWTILQLRAMRGTPLRGRANPLWGGAQASEPGQQPPAHGASLKRLAFGLVMTAISPVNRCIDAAGAGDSLLVEIRADSRR